MYLKPLSSLYGKRNTALLPSDRQTDHHSAVQSSISYLTSQAQFACLGMKTLPSLIAPGGVLRGRNVWTQVRIQVLEQGRVEALEAPPPLARDLFKL